MRKEKPKLNLVRDVCARCGGSGEVIADPVSLRTARKMAKITLEKLSDELGLSLTQTWNMEKGKRRCSPAQGEKWMAAIRRLTT